MVISIDLEEILQIIQEANNCIDGANFYLGYPIVDDLKNLNEDIVRMRLMEDNCSAMRNEILSLIGQMVNIISDLAYRVRLLCNKDLLNMRLCDHLEYVIYNLQKMEPQIDKLEATVPFLISPQQLHTPGVESYVIDFMELKKISCILDELQELLYDIDTELEKIIENFRLLEEARPLSSSILE